MLWLTRVAKVLGVLIYSGFAIPPDPFNLFGVIHVH